MRRRPLPFLLALAFLALPSCIRTPAEPDPDDPRVTGVWSGSYSDTTMTMTLVQVARGEVFGFGKLSTPLVTRSFVVRHGRHTHPDLVLDLLIGEDIGRGDEDFLYSGELVGDTLISGEVYGSRYYNGEMDLTKNGDDPPLHRP